MMAVFSGVREFLYQFRKRFSPPKKKAPRPILPGLPSGLEQQALEALVKEHFEEQVKTVTHQHLSAWKSSGAYRVHIETLRGKQIHLVYKEAVYSEEEIPALNNFPVMPGPPEYVILSQAHGPISKYLPKVYLAEEKEHGRCYRYLLEDLHENYERAFQPKDVIRAAGLIPEMQVALKEWSRTAHTEGLIQYGREFSQALQTYTHASLERFAQDNEDKNLIQVLREWKEISSMHLNEEFFRPPLTLIHGDSNFTNIHLHLREAGEMKMVDWEWAGFGLPFSDLASLLKGAKPNVARSAYNRYYQALSKQAAGAAKANEPDVFAYTPEQARRVYLWQQMERGLLDAGFLAAQHLETSHITRFSLPGAVSKSLYRVIRAYQQLETA